MVEPSHGYACYSTPIKQPSQQRWLKKIASKCDYFFVIGSDNSSNSLRLVEVAKNYGAKKSILIENIHNFDSSVITGIKTIGITASASAPEILVKNLIKKLSHNYEINIIESSFEKEDIHFKIPQKLKKAI